MIVGTIHHLAAPETTITHRSHLTFDRMPPLKVPPNNTCNATALTLLHTHKKKINNKIGFLHVLLLKQKHYLYLHMYYSQSYNL